MASKMATPIANILHVFPLIPLHLRLDQCTAEQDGKELGTRSHSGTLLKRATLVEAKRRRYTVAVRATVNQLAAYAIRTGSDVQSTAIGALASVLIRQQAQSIPRLRSYSNKAMVRWRNRILDVLNWPYSVFLVVARSRLVIAGRACD
jgi:hypothetical protein